MFPLVDRSFRLSLLSDPFGDHAHQPRPRLHWLESNSSFHIKTFRWLPIDLNFSISLVLLDCRTQFAVSTLQQAHPYLLLSRQIQTMIIRNFAFVALVVTSTTLSYVDADRTKLRDRWQVGGDADSHDDLRRGLKKDKKVRRRAAVAMSAIAPRRSTIPAMKRPS